MKKAFKLGSDAISFLDTFIHLFDDTDGRAPDDASALGEEHIHSYVMAHMRIARVKAKMVEHAPSEMRARGLIESLKSYQVAVSLSEKLDPEGVVASEEVDCAREMISLLPPRIASLRRSA